MSLPPPGGAHLKGQLLQSRLEYVHRHHGPPGVERVLAALPADQRDALRGLQREAWYPFGTLVRLDQAIASTVAAGEPDIFFRLGLASARHRTEWLGEHARLVSVHAFLSRVADQHRQFHTFGRGEYRRVSFTRGELAFLEYPETDPTFCQGARGYLLGTVELVSGGPAQVDERTCQCRAEAACLFDLRWEERSASETAGTTTRPGRLP